MKALLYPFFRVNTVNSLTTVLQLPRNVQHQYSLQRPILFRLQSLVYFFCQHTDVALLCNICQLLRWQLFQILPIFFPCPQLWLGAGKDYVDFFVTERTKTIAEAAANWVRLLHHHIMFLLYYRLRIVGSNHRDYIMLECIWKNS